MPSAAVVILNWNGAHHLRRFLPGVLAHTPGEVRIVVTDNGSTDDSLALLRSEFPSVEIVALDRNYGFTGGYNRALKRIEADRYVLMNSDIAPLPGWYPPLAEYLDSHPGHAAVMPKIRALGSPARFEYAGACGGFVDALGYPFCRGRILSTVEPDEGQYDNPRDVFWASGACFCCRAADFHAAGGFDEAFFAHMEEIDLCWRMQLGGRRIGVEPRSVVQHLGGGTLAADSPRKLYLNFRNNLSMLYKNLPAGSLWWKLPLRMILDGCSALVYLATGHPDAFRAVWNAHRDFRRRLPELRPVRRSVQEGRTAEPQGVYRGSVLLRYLFRKRFGTMM